MSVILFLLILSILVFVHELGHFLFAKWCGIRVDSFAIGFPPTLWKKTVGETTYKINALPLGGYVSIYGENYEALDTTDTDFERSFSIKKWWQQLSVLAAGILFNMIFAFLLLTIVGWIGAPTIVENYAPQDNYRPEVRLTIASVMPESPADKAGIRPGDSVISSYQSNNEAVVLSEQMLTIENLMTQIQQSDGINLSLLYKKETREVTIAPENGLGASGLPGIGIGLTYIEIRSEGVLEAFAGGSKRLVSMTSAVGQGLGSLFTGGAQIKDLTGPVGLTGIVAEASQQGFATLLLLTAFISINLALLNLLPFPALDGGRMVFVIIETITKKRIPAKVGMWINGIGFVLLMLLMIAVTIKDVIGLF